MSKWLKICPYVISVVLLISVQARAEAGLTGNLENDLNSNTSNTNENSLTNIPSISEVYPYPDADSIFPDEFIEINNNSDQPIDLSLFKICDKNACSKSVFYPIGSDILLPGGYFIYCNKDFQLNNSGEETVSITDLSGINLSTVGFSSAKEGMSYNFRDTWYWSSPTPGKENSLKQLLEGGEKEAFRPNSILECKKLSAGSEVIITGSVSVSPFVLSNQYFYIQDNSGGIQIYSYKSDFEIHSAGDRVEIHGTISEVSGEKRIKISGKSDIVFIEKDVEKPRAKSITDKLMEDDIGTMVRVEGLVIQTSGDIFLISVNSQDIKVIIKEGTNINKPTMRKGDKVAVSGIVSIYNGQYRILPISQEDVTIIIPETVLPQSGSGIELYAVTYLTFMIIWILYLKLKMRRKTWQKRLCLFLAMEMLLR